MAQINFSHLNFILGVKIFNNVKMYIFGSHFWMFGSFKNIYFSKTYYRIDGFGVIQMAQIYLKVLIKSLWKWRAKKGVSKVWGIKTAFSENLSY